MTALDVVALDRASPPRPRSVGVTRPSPPGDDSWLAVDLTAVLDGTYQPPAPAVLARSDGQCLFYPGKVHSTAGESESLKSWLSQVASTQEIAAGRHVTYIDFEDDEGSVVSRLLALGAKPDIIATHFHYVRPEHPLRAPANHPDSPLAVELARQPSLVILDGVSEGMVLHGYDPDKGTVDSAKFYDLLPRPLAVAGPAVNLIDHVAKARENRGRYALGPQHKLAGLNGAAYIIDAGKPFGRGLHGIAHIYVSKDRPGQVRPHAAGGKHVGDLHLTSHADGSIDAVLQAPQTTAAGPFRPTAIMEKLSRALEPVTGDGLSKAAAEAMVTGKATTKRLALELLATDGYIAVVRRGSAQYHRSLKPYRAAAELPFTDPQDGDDD